MVLGGGVITDATATPEDVRSEKIFYNNDGRQIGINEKVTGLTSKILSISQNAKCGTFYSMFVSSTNMNTTGVDENNRIGSYTDNVYYTVANRSYSNNDAGINWSSNTSDLNRLCCVLSIHGIDIDCLVKNIYGIYINGVRCTYGIGGSINSFTICKGNAKLGDGYVTDNSNKNYAVEFYPVYLLTNSSGSLTLSDMYIGACLFRSTLGYNNPSSFTNLTVSSCTPVKIVYYTD